MAVPQNITDALNAVQADADALTAAVATQQGTASALVSAQVADTGAQQAVTAAQAHLSTDLASLIALEQQTYGAPALTAKS
jgi:septal ring factor EnvC (AmiA/AmiB activator)